MKIRLIINPKAGVYVKTKRAHPRLEDYFQGSGHKVDSVETTQAGDGEMIARDAVQDGYELVVAVGGDGTLNDVAKGVIGTSTAVGVVPLGSGNGFARHFKIPLVIPWACKSLWEPNFINIDVGEINGRIFLVTCGMGLDADVSLSMDKGLRRGMLAYFWHGAVGLMNYRAPEVILSWNDHMIRTNPILLTVCNLSQYGGGFRIAPGAKCDDGHLDLCWIPPLGTLPSVWHLPRVFGGSAEQIPGYNRQLVKEVRLLRDNPGPAHVDGDPYVAEAELNIKVIPNALKIAIPSRSFKPFVFPNPFTPESFPKSLQEIRDSLRSFSDPYQTRNQQPKDD